jgi:hypothetical protein
VIVESPRFEVQPAKAIRDPRHTLLEEPHAGLGRSRPWCVPRHDDVKATVEDSALFGE